MPARKHVIVASFFLQISTLSERHLAIRDLMKLAMFQNCSSGIQTFHDRS